MLSKKAAFYLELHDDHLFCALLPNGIDGTITKSDRVSLPPRTLIDGILYNPSMLINALHTFITRHQLKRPQSIVVAKLLSEQKTRLPFQVFQITLALAQAGLQITHLTNTALYAKGQRKISTSRLAGTKNYFEQFAPPPALSPSRWYRHSAGALVGLCLCALGINHTLKHKRNALQKKLTALEHDIATLAPIIKEAQRLDGTVKHLRTRLAATQQRALLNAGYHELLTALEQHIPKLTWLTELSARATSGQVARKVVRLSGYSLDVDEIFAFIDQMDACPFIEEIYLSGLEPIEKTKAASLGLKVPTAYELHGFSLEGYLRSEPRPSVNQSNISEKKST